MWGYFLFPDHNGNQKAALSKMKELLGLDAMSLITFLLAPEPSMRLSIEEIIAI